MAICLDRTRPGYSELYQKVKASIPGFTFDSFVSNFLEKYGRYPLVHELPGATSINYLQQNKNATLVKLDKSKDPEVSEAKSTELGILQFNKTTLEEYTYTADLAKDKLGEKLDKIRSKLNQLHPDLAVSKVYVYNDKYRVVFKTLPTQYDVRSPKDTSGVIENSVMALNDAIDNLLRTLDKKIHRVTDLELSTPEWRGIIDHKKTNKAFIYKGDIYINVDHATIEDPIHELLHMFMGSLAKYNRNEYLKLINYISGEGLQNSEDKETLEKELQLELQWSSGLQEDILEELFVSELAKHLTGLYSIFSNPILQPLLELINEGLKFAADLALLGDNSAKLLPDLDFFNMSFADLAKFVNASILKKETVETSMEHRVEVNKINELMDKGNLKYNC